MTFLATAPAGPAPGFEAPGVDDFNLPPIAGIAGLTKPVLQQTPEDWDKVLDVNLRGCFLVAQAAAQRLVQERARTSIQRT